MAKSRIHKSYPPKISRKYFPEIGKTRNRQKSAFPHGGKQEIIENRLSLMGENKKSLKINFPSREKTRNHRKSAFPTLGKQEISENWLSQHWENKKSAKNGFPNIGKTKNRRKMAFPTLGRIKNAIGCISQLSERRKTPKVFCLTFGVRFYFDTLFFIFSLQIYFKACSMSAMISSTFSMPTERRIKSGAIPASRSCSSVS